jgi:hypothetical protein
VQSVAKLRSIALSVRSFWLLLNLTLGTFVFLLRQRTKLMRRLPKFLMPALLFCFWSSSVVTQTPTHDSSEVMRQLLSLPAPIPHAPETVEKELKDENAETFFDKKKPPPDDAPIDDVVRYWRHWVDAAPWPTLTDTIRQRLLDACADNFENLPELLNLLARDDSTSKKVKELFDKAVSDRLLPDGSLDKVKKWLTYNSKYFLNDLVALTSKVKDDDERGSVHKEEALYALARVDWQTAEPFLHTLASGSQPRSSALALKLLYGHAITTKDLDAEETFRNRLKTIASDRNAPARARDTAIEALSTTAWSGRDEWYLSLFADDTPLLSVPHIFFDCMSMWIDEAREKIYLVYKGQLISLPLRKGSI